MFTFRSAKSSIISRQLMASSAKNEGSTTMTNRKCKVSIKEVNLLNFEEYTNPTIFIFLLRLVLPLF
jgi:hypothetical protein